VRELSGAVIGGGRREDVVQSFDTRLSSADPSCLARPKQRVLVTRCWGLGGGQVWAHEFATRLASRGHDVEVIFLRSWWPGMRGRSEGGWGTKAEAGYRLAWLDVPLFFESYGLLRRLRSYLRHRPVDVIVSTGLEAAWLDRLRDGPPHVASFHHPRAERVGPRELIQNSFHLSRRGVARTYLRWGLYQDRLSMLRARQVVCSSKDQAERVVSGLRVPGPKVKVIYYGIDTERFCPAPTRRSASEILYAGGPWANKGLDVLLEAFARIQGRFPQASISVVGGGEWARYQKKIQSLGLSSRVRYGGQVAHASMVDRYRSAYLFAAPTLHESFGLVLAEAMACGLPVVATRVTAIPEVVEEGRTGLLVPVDDVPALAEALQTLLGDPERAAAMGKAGRARVEQRFAWGKVITQWEQLLEEVAQGGRG